ncbi:MAG: hypothetical protein HY744_16060 [Deltaproteobacteria bacterium]|nr:hypothetical protein [Deltaproteobacteria bacterium]
MTGLRIAEDADVQIQRIEAWWRENRRAAPELFSIELADALDALTHTPTLGTSYAERSGVVVRRLLLRRSRYHVYFSYDAAADIVEVRALWHTARGTGPALG